MLRPEAKFAEKCRLIVDCGSLELRVFKHSSSRLQFLSTFSSLSHYCQILLIPTKNATRNARSPEEINPHFLAVNAKIPFLRLVSISTALLKWSTDMLGEP